MTKVNVFGIKMTGEGFAFGITAILLFGGLIILLPLIIIWTANQMFSMGWDYTIQYWFGALALLCIFWALCPPRPE